MRFQKQLSYITFLVIFIITACNLDNNGLTSDEQSVQTENKLDNKRLIKEINQRLHAELGNEKTVKYYGDHSYVYALKDGNGDLEFYYELGYDSEGWPMAGELYYFYQKRLIGYSYLYCDGCIGQDVSNQLLNLEIKEVKTKDDLSEQNVIWSLSEPINEFTNKARKILAINLESLSDETIEEENVTIHNFINNIYSNNENGFETFISFKESYSDNAGIMTLAQNGCRYVYNIAFEGNKLEAKFFKSTCGANSSNTTLYYESSNNTLSMFISGQEFIFYPEF